MSTDALDKDLLLEEGIANPDPALEPVTQDTEPKVKPKYKGKSVFELVEMHENAEKLLARQGQELGELRRQADLLLGLKKENATKEKVPVTAEALLTDPDKMLEQAIGQSNIAEKVDATEKRLENLERSIGQQEFESKFPNFMQDVQDPEFQDWVKANRARAGLLFALDNAYDFDSGAALWEMWEEHKSAPKAVPKTRKKADIAEASTVRNSPAESARKPVYSRAKLLELQARAVRGDKAAQLRWNDPAFQKEYHEAYAEGRVK